MNLTRGKTSVSKRSSPVRSQNTTWEDLIAPNMAVLAAADFFTAEVLTW